MEVIFMQRKTDDPRSIHFHANRIHRTNGLWYFETREGDDVGPFDSKEEARKELSRFMAETGAEMSDQDSTP
jgi:hypothetical protein